MARIGISALHIRAGKCGSHEPYLVNLVHSLSEIDQENQYFVFVNQENRSLFSTSGANFHFLLCSKMTKRVIFRILYEQIILPIKILFRKFDVVHFPGNVISLVHPFPTVVTIHTDSIRARSSMGSLQRSYYDFFSAINSSANKIITPSNYYSHELTTFYNYQPEKMVAIHHGYSNKFYERSNNEKQEFQKKWGIADGAILSVTNTLPHKNLRNLFVALDYIYALENKEIQMVLVGYIDQAVLEKYISEATEFPERMRKRIKVIPFLNNSDLPEIYNAATYFVLPSKEECFGMPLIEAMACNLPIAASNIPAFQEVACDAAIYFDPNDPKDIAEKLMMLMNSDQLKKSLTLNGTKITSSHQWKNTAIATLETYKETISESVRK